jgi:hypothetical protein
MGFLTHLFYRLIQVYRFYVLEKTIIKTISFEYCIQLLQSIHKSSYDNYNPSIGMDIILSVRFKNAGFCCDVLEQAIKLVETNGYLDERFVTKIIALQKVSLDDFLTTTNGSGIDVVAFADYYLDLLKTLSGVLQKVDNNEKRGYYERRLNLLLPSLVEISEGLLSAVKSHEYKF